MWYSDTYRPFWQVHVVVYMCLNTDFLRHVMQDIYRQCFSVFTGYTDSGMCINYFMEVFVFFSNDSWTKLMRMCRCTVSCHHQLVILRAFADCCYVGLLLRQAFPRPSPMINGFITRPLHITRSAMHGPQQPRYNEARLYFRVPNFTLFCSTITRFPDMHGFQQPRYNEARLYFWVPNFTPFCSTIARFPDNWGFWFLHRVQWWILNFWKKIIKNQKLKISKIPNIVLWGPLGHTNLISCFMDQWGQNIGPEVGGKTEKEKDFFLKPKSCIFLSYVSPT